MITGYVINSSCDGNYSTILAPIQALFSEDDNIFTAGKFKKNISLLDLREQP